MSDNYFTSPLALIASVAAGCVFIAAIAASQLVKKEDPVGRYEFKAGDHIHVDAAQISGLTPYNSPTHLYLKIKDMDGCGLAVLYKSKAVESGKLKMTFEPKNIICQNEVVSGSMSASNRVGKVTVPAPSNEIEPVTRSDINLLAPNEEMSFLVLNSFNWARGYVK